MVGHRSVVFEEISVSVRFLEKGGNICGFETVWEAPFFQRVIYSIGNWSPHIL